MDVYAAPRSDLGSSPRKPLPLAIRLLLLPVILAGAVVTAGIAFWLSTRMPLVGGSKYAAIASILSHTVLAAVGGAAPWWYPIAKLFPNHSVRVALAAGAGPVLVRIALTNSWPASAMNKAVALVDTVGVLVAFALGAALVARRLGANNSSKPTPLRGAA
jgi:hypothetical protein